jgi:hypothetical protein
MKSQPIQPGSSGASMANALSDASLEQDSFADRLTPFRYGTEQSRRVSAYNWIECHGVCPNHRASPAQRADQRRRQLWIGGGLGRRDGR